jgi:NADPH-dependent 2,4-dienoyl-CoA reductase/sulfur reductase-like enzyme
MRLLDTMGDTFALHHAFTAGARSAIIVGGGYIGLEMAEAFTTRGLAVTLVEQAPAVMPTVDEELGRLLGEELRRRGVEVVNGVTVKAIHQDPAGLTVAGEPDFAATADLVLVVVGVRPDTELATAAGVQTGLRGALRVDRRMRTNLPGMLAAGDCAETYHRLLDRPATFRLGPPRTSRAGSPARPPWAGTASSQGRWAPRSSRSSTWPPPAPANATRTPARLASTR